MTINFVEFSHCMFDDNSRKDEGKMLQKLHARGRAGPLFDSLSPKNVLGC